MPQSEIDAEPVAYLYTKEELTNSLQCFKREHELVEQGKGASLGSPLTLKCIMVGINLCMLAFSLWEWGFDVTMSALTNWALVIETLHMITSIKCGLDSEADKKWLVFHHISFEIMFPLNLLVVSVYWTLLRDEVVLTCPTLTTWMHTTIVHILPMLFNFISFAITDVVAKPSHGQILLPIGAIYGYTNYKATIRQGNPVYSFLPWTDYKSALIIA